MYTPLRTSPPSHPQAYASLDYSAQIPMMLSGPSAYGHGVTLQGMPLYRQGIRSGRNDSEPTVALRSPLLEAFRVDKDRKWELQVGE
jgi:hypothetical protein